MDTHRRHEPPGPETKESFLVITMTVASVSVFCCTAAIPRWQCKGQMTPSHAVGCVISQERNAKLRRCKFYITKR